MIQLYTGEGKGKTTAAIGQAIRCAGNGKKVLFTQFMKGNHTGELEILKDIPKVEILRSDKNFGFYSSMSEEQKQELTQIHNEMLRKILSEMKAGTVQMVVMDEITYPAKWGLMDDKLFSTVLKEGKERSSKSTDKYPELILTGRNPSKEMTDMSDYITRMEAIRHPYERGIQARIGIEF